MCCTSNKTLELSNMGENIVKSHVQSEKLKQNFCSESPNINYHSREQLF